MFTVTQEEIKSALESTGGIKFEKNVVVNFLITSIDEKKADNKVVVKCTVMDTEHKGKDYSHYFSVDKDAGKKNLIQLVSKLVDLKDYVGKDFSQVFNSLIGKTFSAKTWENKSGYINFGDWKASSSGPSLDVGSVDIPF